MVFIMFIYWRYYLFFYCLYLSIGNFFLRVEHIVMKYILYPIVCIYVEIKILFYIGMKKIGLFYLLENNLGHNKIIFFIIFFVIFFLFFSIYR